MPLALTNLFLNITDPISAPDKFLWRELSGDYIQVFGKSLDMKARITQKGRRSFSLTLFVRDGAEIEISPLRSIEVAKKRAEASYSAWIKATSLKKIEY
jgi:hypothetical protein